MSKLGFLRQGESVRNGEIRVSGWTTVAGARHRLDLAGGATTVA